MTIMKIRGGDLDLVSYEFSPFLPGENIKKLSFEGHYPLHPEQGTVHVRAPARIHLTVLDMNRFSPNRPGGGGVGFAIQLFSDVEVECTPSGVEIEYGRSSILRHLVAAFSRAVGYTGGFRIRASDHPYKHVGLGSTSTVTIALASAMNAAVGSPLTQDQLRYLVGNNYVEETTQGMITHAFETGVGPAVSTYGGMAVMGDELTLAFHHPFAEGYTVYIIIPASDISSAGDREFDLLMNKARSLDYRDRELKAYMILMDLIPALENGDLRRAGDTIWEIDFRGSKRAEVEHHGFVIYHYMNKLREAGLEFVGMSSVGPTIAVVTGRERREIEAIIGPLGLTIAVQSMVDNKGLIVTMPGQTRGRI